jgi:hypothetical protein
VFGGVGQIFGNVAHQGPFIGSNTNVNAARETGCVESIGTTARAFAGLSDKMGRMSARTVGVHGRDGR